MFLVTSLATSTYLGYYLPLILVSLFTLTIGIIATLSSPGISRRIWLYLPFYFLLTEIPFSFLLKTYAVLHINHCSWGTKELIEKELQEPRSNYFIALWLVSNLILMIIVLHFHLYGLLLILAMTDLLIGLIAGIVIAGMTLKNK